MNTSMSMSTKQQTTTTTELNKNKNKITNVFLLKTYNLACNLTFKSADFFSLNKTSIVSFSTLYWWPKQELPLLFKTIFS